MGTWHTVEQGEYLSKIALEHGFADYLPIWDAGENAKLKAERKNPNVLYPGDELFIPGKELRVEPRPTEKRHFFELNTRPLQLRIVLTDLKNKPLQGHDCTFTVEDQTKKLITPDNGKMEAGIPLTAATGFLRDRGKPGEEFSITRDFPLKIGNLDPVEHVSGQIGRLNNLGYRAGDLPDHPFTEDDEKIAKKVPQFLSAVEEFQCDFQLTVDGVCGPKTQAKLKEAHGC